MSAGEERDFLRQRRDGLSVFPEHPDPAKDTQKEDAHGARFFPLGC